METPAGSFDSSVESISKICLPCSYGRSTSTHKLRSAPFAMLILPNLASSIENDFLRTPLNSRCQSRKLSGDVPFLNTAST